MTKALLRYPGGKVKAIKYIAPFWQHVAHSEYREPFVGGGSVFISKPPVQTNWINDIDREVVAFYKIIRNEKSREELIQDLLTLDITQKTYDELFFSKPRKNYEQAKKFYFLNRTSFSGIRKWRSFIGDVRYNIKLTQNMMREVGMKLEDYKITSLDFEDVLKKPYEHDGVFIFLDPPYSESRQIVAYNHAFEKEDHMRLAKILKKTKALFLLTYDDTEFIRDLYDWAELKSYTWTYTVANSKIHHNPRESGNELFISNFKLPKQDILTPHLRVTR